MFLINPGEGNFIYEGQKQREYFRKLRVVQTCEPMEETHSVWRDVLRTFLNNGLYLRLKFSFCSMWASPLNNSNPFKRIKYDFILNRENFLPRKTVTIEH